MFRYTDCTDRKPYQSQETNKEEVELYDVAVLGRKSKRNLEIKNASKCSRYLFSRTAMARTFLDHENFVLDMVVGAALVLIIALGQEANRDDLGMSFQFSIK